MFKLFDAHKKCFESPQKQSDNNAVSLDRKHGRYEKRSCVVVTNENLINLAQENRSEIKTIFKITRYREQNDLRPFLQVTGPDGKQTYKRNDYPSQKRSSQEEVYYISSQKLTADQALHHTREHWGIENKLHWKLDVHFEEDSNQVRDKRAAQNLSALRKLAFNVFTLLPDPTLGLKLRRPATLKQKMKLASMEHDYFDKVVKALTDPKSFI